MSDLERNQLVKAVCDKKGVTSMKLVAKTNVDRSLVSTILRKSVKYSIQESKVVSQAKSFNRGRRVHFTSHQG